MEVSRRFLGYDSFVPWRHLQGFAGQSYYFVTVKNFILYHLDLRTQLAALGENKALSGVVTPLHVGGMGCPVKRWWIALRSQYPWCLSWLPDCQPNGSPLKSPSIMHGKGSMGLAWIAAANKSLLKVVLPFWVVGSA
jgi:hypothetical protein